MDKPFLDDMTFFDRYTYKKGETKMSERKMSGKGIIS